MTSTIVRPNYFDTYSPQALAGTLLTAANVSEDVGFLEPTGVLESYNCLTVDTRAVYPCPAVLLAAPVQAASSTATTGGTIPAGTYRAVITAINERGETIASNEITQVTTGAASTITWNWANLVGETGYRVYITNTNGASGTETFVIQLAANTTSYIWTGTPANDDVTFPPTVNTAVVSVTKTFNHPSWEDGIRFAVYGGFECKMFEDGARSEGFVRAAFEAKETLGVARALMQLRFTTPAATDLTPVAGAVNPEVGLAILEGDASSKYAGVPTIHAPRTIGTLLTRDGVIFMQGDQLFSVQGSKIASDGGYQSPNNSPTNTAPAVGEYWMYSTGEVTIKRSPLFLQTELNRSTNETVTLVERLYVAAIDCGYNAAVRVKIQ